MSDIHQKPERIASAIYLLTGFFVDLEPAKWKLRNLAADLVSIAVSLKSQMFKEREAARLEIRAIISEIHSLMAVAKNAGLVSEQNFDVMRSELERFVENLGFPAGLKDEQGMAVLSRSFFGGETRELRSSEPNAERLEAEKDKKPEENLSYKSRELLPSSTEHKEKPLREFGAVSVKKNSRQSIIISLLKRKKEIMIKDVSPLIQGCSEKTIQRELLTMVHAGILKKTGEKRWSRYSLA